MYTIYSLEVPANEGDLLMATAEQQFTENASNYNYGAWSQIVARKGETEIWLTRTSGRNITQDMHHDTHEKNGSMIVPETGTWTIIYQAKANSTQGTQALTVDNLPNGMAGGFLQVIIFD